MDDETPTPEESSDPTVVVGEVVYGEIVQTRAQEAYEMKLSGKPWYEIADEVGYASASDAAKAVSNMLKSQATLLSEDERTMQLRMELDRLDMLQSRVWPAAMTGDPKSVEAALKIIDRRIRITGMDAADTASQQHTVLVIGGQESDYVEKLKELSSE